MRKLAGLLLVLSLAACNKTVAPPPPEVKPVAAAPVITPPPPATPPPASPPAEPTPPPAGDEVRPPTAADLATYTADLKGKGPLQATIETNHGSLHCELFDKKAPMTVANFVGLARGLKPFRNPKTNAVEKRPFFDGLIFHRVIPGFMIQGGDPLGLGMGNPGYKFANEISPELQHEPGTLSMANAGPGTNGSQFFVTEAAQHRLDGSYNVFGRCRDLDVVKAIAAVPKDPTDGSGSRPAAPVVMKHVIIHR